MNRIYKYILCCLLPVISMSCSDVIVETYPVISESVVLSFESGIKTKATEADTPLEATVSYVDVMIFNEDGNEIKHYERVDVNDVESGSFALSKVKSEFEESTPYQVYLVANSNISSSDFGSITTVGDLKLKIQEDRHLLFTGTGGTNPSFFLMDAVAFVGETEPSSPSTVVLNDGNSAETTVLKAVFRRAAAKIEVVINKGNDVTFIHGIEAIPQYYMRNYPYSTTIVDSDVTYDRKLMNSEPAVISDAEWTADCISISAYAYSYDWTGESAYEKETSLVVNIPMTYNGEDKTENWYKIPVSKTSTLERNYYYKVIVSVNAPGGSRLDPEDMPDLYIEYEAAPWEEVGITIGGETNRPKYLQLNTDHVDMYNVNEDLETLRFASSSEIATISLVEAYYYDKYDNRIDLAVKDDYHVYSYINAVPDPGVLNGGIDIYSPFVEKTDKEITEILGFPPDVPAIPPMPTEPVDKPDIDDFIEDLNGGGNNYEYRAVKGGNNQLDKDHELNYRIQRKKRNDNDRNYRDNNDATNQWTELVKAYLPWENMTPEELQEAKNQYATKLAEYNAAMTAHEQLDEYLDDYNSLKGEKHSNAIRYLTFTVTNEDGISVDFTVTQYPTLYITNEHGRYSYRDDFNGTTYESQGSGGNINSANFKEDGTGWNYYHDTNYGGRLFQSKVYDESDGYIDYYYWSKGKVYHKDEHGHDLRNPRMYHVHVTATSLRYTVAVPRLNPDGYTESSADNSHLVSPSFMIASQLGATLSPGSVDEAKSHCSQYVEVTKATNGKPKKVYDDWRLPTAAEVDIIIQHQYASEAMDEVLSGKRYWCAFTLDGSFSVENPHSESTSGTIAVRCVRDEL